VQVGHRYNYVIGIWIEAAGTFKFEVFADGIDPPDPMPRDRQSWGEVKDLFR
jgi:hypothetical protein